MSEYTVEKDYMKKCTAVTLKISFSFLNLINESLIIIIIIEAIFVISLCFIRIFR